MMEIRPGFQILTLLNTWQQTTYWFLANVWVVEECITHTDSTQTICVQVKLSYHLPTSISFYQVAAAGYHSLSGS